MFIKERLDEISRYLRKNKKATVEELADLLAVSPATVRRDLSEMQTLGLVARTHGGVTFLADSEETSIFVRQDKNAQHKENTALIAAQHIPHFQTAFIDNSSTCYALMKRLNLQHKTVFTNGLQLALTLSKQEDINIVMPGGEVKYNTGAVTGSSACITLSNIRPDIALFSCAAIDTDGAYEFSMDSCEIKRAALAASKYSILLADLTKFNKSAAYRTCKLDAFDAIFTNAEDAVVAPYREKGLNIHNTLK